MNDHSKAEWFDGLNWISLPDFPFKNHYSYYAVLSRDTDFIYFGGAGDGGNSSRVTMFVGLETIWKQFGFLKNARHA